MADGKSKDLKFTSGEEVDPSELYVKLLLYGDSGSGKTWKAAQGYGKVVVLLTERNGEQPCRLANPKAKYVIVNSAEEVRGFTRLLMSGAFAGWTVVVDGLTEVQRLIKDEMQAERGDGEFAIRDWGELNEKMRKLIRVLRDAPNHVICTAIAEYEMEAEVRHCFPAFQGKKLWSEVMQFFNAVGYCYKVPGKDEVTFWTMFDGPARVLCKSAHPLKGTRKDAPRDWIAEMISTRPTATPVAPPLAPDAPVANDAPLANAEAATTPEEAATSEAAPLPDEQTPAAPAKKKRLTRGDAEPAKSDGPPAPPV